MAQGPTTMKFAAFAPRQMPSSATLSDPKEQHLEPNLPKKKFSTQRNAFSTYLPVCFVHVHSQRRGDDRTHLDLFVTQRPSPPNAVRVICHCTKH